VYGAIGSLTPLGSQYIIKAIAAVCAAYRSLKAKKAHNDSIPVFKATSSVHVDKRLYSLKDDDMLSVKTLAGRILVPMIVVEFQQNYFLRGVPKEAELVCNNGIWFFNLVFDIPDVEPLTLLSSSTLYEAVLGIDLGENNLATTSSGKIFKGGLIRFKRDCELALRKRLQRNGSKSAKQLLRKISGKEARYMKHINHIISKALIKEALDAGCTIIALENLTNIRQRIKAGKRMRLRLHRWAWAQLQRFIEYKAKAAGLIVIYVNPAYTSKECAECGNIGRRSKHRFECKACGILRHSDVNGSLNIRKIALSADRATASVNRPNVAAAQSR
jgi:putative transposase